MIALAHRAGVALHRLVSRRAVDHGGVLVGVGHAGRGELGQHCLNAGAGLGSQPTRQPRHAVDVLVAQHQPAATGTVLVGVAAVGVEAGAQPLGQFDQVIRAMFGGQLGQMGFGLLAGVDIDALRQVRKESPDHFDMAGADLAVALGRGGRGQLGRQRLSGDRAARTQIRGLGHPPAGFARGDAQPVSQRLGQSAAQFFGRGLLSELIDQGMSGHPKPPSLEFELVQVGQPLRRRERVILMPDNPRHHLMQRGVIRLDLGGITRTHVRNTSPAHRQNRAGCVASRWPVARTDWSIRIPASSTQSIDACSGPTTPSTPETSRHSSTLQQAHREPQTSTHCH